MLVVRWWSFFVGPLMKISCKQGGWIAASLLLLGGCAGVRTVDTDVTAFTKWTAAPPGPATTYRFERLPSQQMPQEQQAAVETLARASLAKVGMVFNPAAPRYTVQVDSTIQQLNTGYNGYGGSGVFLGGGGGGGGGGGFGGIGLSFPLGRGASASARHDLTIVMRDVSTQQVVYETRASHGAASDDRLAVLPAMMDAALRGFPEPPPGTRRISVEMPR
jgi:Domain of unknown function (DUF4136)